MIFQQQFPLGSKAAEWNKEGVQRSSEMMNDALVPTLAYQVIGFYIMWHCNLDIDCIYPFVCMRHYAKIIRLKNRIICGHDDLPS